MSLVDRANELEYVPEEQLIQMSQSPDGQYPQFLVLSEIQRRNQMRRMYENQMAKMNQPSTTVAEEAVMEFAGQGAVPMMDSPSTLSSTSDGGLRSMAPIPMKSGRKTEVERAEDELSEELREILAKDARYKQRYEDYESGERFFYPLTPREYIVSDDEYKRLREQGKYMREGDLQDYRPFLALLGALSGEDAPRYMPESKVKGLQAMLEATRKEKQMQQMGMQAGGITQMQAGGSLGLTGDSLSQSFQNPMLQQQEEMDEGTLSKAVNWAKENPMDALNLAANATFFLPGVGFVAGAAIKGGIKALPFIAKAAKAAFTKPKDPLKITRVNTSQPLGESAKRLGLGAAETTIPQTGRVFSPSRTSLFGLPALGIGYNVTNAALGGFGEDKSKLPSNTGLTEQERKALESRQKLQNLISTDSTATPSEKGLSSMDYLTLAQVGGIFGGAKNLGEAAMGLGNLAGQIAETRRKQPLETAQMDLLRAQIAKYEADVANLPLDAAIKQYQSLNDLVDSGVITPEEAKLREIALTQRIAYLQGIESTTPTRSYSQYLEAS